MSTSIAQAVSVLAFALCASRQVYARRLKVDATQTAQRDSLEDSASSMSDWGAFSGIIMDSEFQGADFWGRDGKIVPVVHRSCERASCDVVLAAEYSDTTHVSQVVYYRVDAQHFCVGCGRGTGWQNDELLALSYNKDKEYATRADYDGVGHFLFDRGHQAPVGSFNSEITEADITNLPSNLSPQNGELNQKNWRFLEADIRTKASELSESSSGGEPSIEVITGPMYELPSAMFEARQPARRWRELIKAGGQRLSSKGKMKRDPIPLCAEKAADGTYTDDLGKKASMTCTPRYNFSVSDEMSVADLKSKLAELGLPVSGAKAALIARVRKVARKDPRLNPNALAINFDAGKSTSTLLRVPLGYYKMFVIKGRKGIPSRTCAFVFDQIGQCMLTSVKLLESLAHIDFSRTTFTKGLKKGKVGKFTEEVDPEWCVPPESILGRGSQCILQTASASDPNEITTQMIDQYWRERAGTDEEDQEVDD